MATASSAGAASDWAVRPRATALRVSRPRPANPANPAALSRRVFHTVRRMQLTGSTVHEAPALWRRHGARARLQTVADLPRAFVDDRSADDARAYENMVTFNGTKRSFVLLIREMYDLIETPRDTHQTSKKALQMLLHEIVQRVLEPNVFHSSGGAGGVSDAVMDAIAAERERFLCLGGAECLLRVMHALRLEDHAPTLPAVEPMTPRGEITGASAAALTDQQTVRHCRNVTDRFDVRSLWATPSPVRVGKHRHDTLNRLIMNDAMGILRELAYFSITLARELCGKDGLIVYLFQLMTLPKLFDNAAGLVEEILAVREDSFDLSRIPGFDELVDSFTSRQLSFFCRVLALVVFEPEDRRLLETSKVIKSTELLKLRRNRLLRADNVVDRNHAIIYNSPTIMKRLLKVLKVQNFYFSVSPVYEPFTSDLTMSTDFSALLSRATDRTDWDTVDRLLNSPHLSPDGELSVLRRAREGSAEDAMAHAHDHQHDHDHGHGHGHDHHHPYSIESTILRDLIFRRGEPSETRAREELEMQVIMKSISLAPYRVEVLFVLCTLLNGKRKIDFQDRLAAMGLVDSLNMMFDKFEWHTTTPPSAQAPLHGPGCGCSLDASLKIQFLRLIHNFCDRDYSDNTSKLLLLSPHELEMLKEPDMDPIDLSHPDKGLLCKIIRTLIDQPADSIYRFWLSSCVEAFLRRAAPNEQLFVARTPLLKSLVDEILSGGAYRAQGSFQSSFDLLGEMTKGNWQTLQLFHRLLDDVEFGSFMEVVIRNLVDSNVFVRSMLLSGEKFAKQPGVGTFGMADNIEMDRMGEFLTVNAVRLLKDLMTIVTLEDVNHENICCLNTAIVIFIFQHRRNRLAVVLDALRDHEQLSGKAGYVCSNFRSLLWFWIQYYTPRGRDRLSLEHSSDVKFEEWRDVVALLCADDGSPTALLERPMTLPASPYSRLYASLVPRRNT